MSTTSVGVFCFTITEVPIAVGGRLPPPVRTPVGQVQGSLRATVGGVALTELGCVGGTVGCVGGVVVVVVVVVEGAVTTIAAWLARENTNGALESVTTIVTTPLAVTVIGTFAASWT